MTSTLINGVAASHIDVNDRSIHYGDGLFETILGKHDTLFYWAQHYQRLRSCAERLGLNCPDEQVFLSDIRYLLQHKEDVLPDAYAIKIILTRGSSERGYMIPKKIAENRIVLLSAVAADYPSLISGQLITGELYVCKQQVSINENLAGIKHLNRLENVLARNEWRDSVNDNFIDGLMLDADQHVIEATMSNLFAVKDNQLYTPDLRRSGVNGIMRDMVIDAAKRNNIPVSCLDLSLDDLFDVEELFISNSLMGIRSVSKMAHRSYADQNITKIIFKDLLHTKDNHVEVVN